MKCSVRGVGNLLSSSNRSKQPVVFASIKSKYFINQRYYFGCKHRNKHYHFIMQIKQSWRKIHANFQTFFYRHMIIAVEWIEAKKGWLCWSQLQWTLGYFKYFDKRRIQFDRSILIAVRYRLWQSCKTHEDTYTHKTVVWKKKVNICPYQAPVWLKRKREDDQRKWQSLLLTDTILIVDVIDLFQAETFFIV